MNIYIKGALAVFFLLGIAYFTHVNYLKDNQSELEQKINELEAQNKSLLSANTSKEKENKKLLGHLKAQEAKVVHQSKSTLVGSQEEAKQTASVESNEASEQASPKTVSPFLNPQFFKTSVPIQVSQIVKDLQNVLNLTDQQANELKDFLTSKALAEIDLSAPILELMQDKEFQKYMTGGLAIEGIDDPILRQKYETLQVQVQDGLAKLQSDFENNLSSIMSLDEIDRYREYESQKHQRKSQMMMSMQIGKIKKSGVVLSAAQEEEIKQMYEDAYSKQVPLGTVGQYSFLPGFSSQQSQLNKQVKEVFDFDQLDTYKKYQEQQKKMFQSFIGLESQ